MKEALSFADPGAAFSASTEPFGQYVGLRVTCPRCRGEFWLLVLPMLYYLHCPHCGGAARNPGIKRH